jgi:ATP-binding cassette subfamily B protein
MRLWHLLRPYRAWLLLAVVIALLPAISQAVLATLVRPLYDQVLVGGRYELLGSLLLRGGGLLLLVVLGGYLFEAYLGYLAVRIPASLRERLGQSLLRAELSRLPGSAALAGRILADLRELETFILHALGIGLLQGMSLLALLVALFGLNLTLTLSLLLLLPVLALLTGLVGRLVGQASGRTQAQAERVALTLTEVFGRLELVRALGLEPFAQDRLEQESGRFYRLGLRRALYTALHLPISQVFTGLALGLLLGLGIREVVAGNLTAGGLTAYLTLLGLAIAPLQVIPKTGLLWAQADAAAGRLLELFSLPPAPPEGSETGPVEGHLCFEDVSFTYPGGESGLRGVSLRLEPGTLTALVGPSGAGKSTLLRLVLGLYRPTSGRVLLDGKPLSSYRHAALARSLAWVPQEPLFFGGSLAENLAALAPGTDPEQAQAALLAVGLWKELPQGLQSDPAALSVGQRQRLAIAAALLRDAKVLVLDEATSALDLSAEAQVMAALEQTRPGRTLLVVAHRLSSVQHADRILVLKDGRLAEEGRHQGLLEQGGLYAQLWRAGGMVDISHPDE